MTPLKSLLIAILLLASLPAPLHADGKYFVVEYPSSKVEGELPYGVTYSLWVPEGVQTLRGVIVHQHGCGEGACKGGETAAYDLHWQALARKWDCALLGPSYHQKDGENCRLWCDPRNGSNQTFLRSLTDLARQSGHPEVETVPWCLWGHSGGGFWASLMQTMHPERIVAIWFRSGTAYATWEKGEIPKPEIPAAAYGIPIILNPGLKERDDKRFAGAWTGSMAMFKAYRPQGALVGFAPDPRTAHECGDSRYLAIPFFDACLAQRLPDPGAASQALKPIDPKSGWLAPLEGDAAVPASQFTGNPLDASWLPGEAFARAWVEYVRTGVTSDTTPPAPPRDVRLTRDPDGNAVLTWDVHADFESGVGSFLIRRDGTDLVTLPEKPVARFGRALFQGMSYHDTPEKPVAELRYVDRAAGSDPQHKYEIVTINSAGLKSEPALAK